MKKVMINVLLIAFTTEVYAATAGSELEDYAKSITETTENSITYSRFEQTISTPISAYKITFVTEEPSLMADDSASAGTVGYVKNRMLSNIWNTRFCTDELAVIMRRHRVDIVNGDLTNTGGNTQSIAVCSP